MTLPDLSSMVDAGESDPGNDSIAALASNYGEKKISSFQSVCLLLNNVTGAAMILYPGLLQQAGWLAPIACMCAIAALTAVSALCLIKTMQLIPANSEFKQRFEFMNVAEHFLSPRQYKVAFVFFILSLFSSAIPLIVQSAQVMDFMLVAIFGQTCGLQFSPHVAWVCSSNSTDNVDPFGSGVVIVSVGVLVIAALCIPVGMWNLDDNMAIQVGATLCMLAILAVWFVFFATLGFDLASMPAIGSDFSKVLGIVVFNYTFITCVPSWVNEKAPVVSVVASVVASLSGATAIFVALGVTGALAYAPFFDSGADLLDKLNQSGSTLIRVTYFMFPIVVNLTSIPIFSIVIKYNLLSNNVCSRPVAAFCAVVLPWVLTVPFYCGQGFLTIVTWTGVFTQSIINFIVPMYMYILAIRKYGNQRGYVALANSQQQYHNYGSASMLPATLSAHDASRASIDSPAWSERSLNKLFAADQAASSEQDFIDPLFACSSNNQYDSVGCGGRRCCDRVCWAWWVLALFCVFMAATFAVDIYYLAIGQSLL